MKNKLAVLSVALLTMAGTGFAAEAQEDEWRFGVVVPLWAPRIDGDATVHGIKKDVGISFDKLKDHLDASYALGLEARKDKFGIYGDFGYMKFSGDKSTVEGNLKASVDLKFLIVDGGVSYCLLKTDGERPFILEANAGVRYWHVDTNLKLKDSGGVVLLDDGFNKDLLDPIVGLRGSKFFTPKLHLDMAGDIGGFGISDHTSTLD